MKTSDSKSRSGYSQRPHMKGKWFVVRMVFFPTGTSVMVKGSEPMTQHFIPGTPSHSSPGMRARIVKLLSCSWSDDPRPFLTPASRGTRVLWYTFAWEVLKAASQNSHYLCPSGSNSFIGGITTWLPESNIFKPNAYGIWKTQAGLGTSCPWQRESAGFWTSVCVKSHLQVLGKNAHSQHPAS